jgi:hypothetical protein
MNRSARPATQLSMLFQGAGGQGGDPAAFTKVHVQGDGAVGI